MNVVRSEADVLKSHHINLSWFRLAEVVLFLAVVVGMYVHTVRVDSENLGKFQAMHEEYVKSRDAHETEMKENYEARLKEAGERLKRDVAISSRTQANDKKKDDVLANQDSVKAQDDFYGAYGRSVTFGSGLFNMDLDTLKQTVVAKLDATTFKTNFEDSQKNVESLQKDNATLTSDLANKASDLNKCDASLTQLQKVKTPSKFKKVMGRVIDIGIGFIVGKALGSL